MSGAGTEDVRARARRGVWMLLWRFGAVQALTLATGIFLARWLGPEPFGLLAVAQALIGIFGLVGDLGLGAALIQKQGAVADGERHAVFTVQVLLATALGALVLALGPPVAGLVWKAELSRALLGPIVLATMIAPYRSLALVSLERDLRFARVAAIETGEHAAYCGVALALAHEGWGVAALAGAILARNVGGALLAALLAGWRPRFTTALGLVRPLIAFGVAQQTSNIVFVGASLVLPVTVGRYAGERLLGLVLWAVGNAERPKPLLDVIARVAFPSYARLGATPETLRAGLDRTLHGGLLATALYGGLLGGVAPVLVPLLYTNRWVEGVPYLYVFLALTPLLTTTILLDVTFLARGDARVVRNAHLVRLALSWGLAIPATRTWGVPGFLGAHALAMLAFAAAEVALARSFAPPSFLLRVALWPLVAGALAALAARAALGIPGLAPLATVAVATAAGAAAFAAVELLLDRARVEATVRLLVGRPAAPRSP